MTRLDQFITTHAVKPGELAELAKVSPAHLSRLRSGKSKPTLDVMRRIARACSWIACQQVAAWELFDEMM